MNRFKWWIRHHKWNPIPCTCYVCEIKKPLPPVLAAYLRQKMLEGKIPRRTLPRRDESD